MAIDTMLAEAIEAIRLGDKAKAKDILTRLIKADQHNANYWVWMSAAVDTQKERIYALKAALHADPENASAKRGLVLFGAIPPDENITPFPLDKPRLWEDELNQVNLDDSEVEKEFKKTPINPMPRLIGIGIGVLSLIALAVFGFSKRETLISFSDTVTPGPSPTFTLTPTALNAKPISTAAFEGATPLAVLLDLHYTPTPLYVNTPRSVQASDYGNAVKAAYRDENWEALISAMEQIALLEPESADPYYYIGEAYRFMQKYNKALTAYNKAININEDFGPAYVGKARVFPQVGASNGVRSALNTAIEIDPYFAEAYLERAIYWQGEKEYEKALEDLSKAEKLSPHSPLVYFNFAQVYFAQEELEEAIISAEKALELDRTNLATYLLLGQLYQANDEIEKAVEVLEIYILYEKDNAEAFAIIGGAYYADNDYEKAIELLNKALKLDRYSSTAYLYRGLSYLKLEDGENAVSDLNKANDYLKTFETSISLAQAEALRERYGNCFLQVQHTRALAETDLEEALIYYWRATCHEGREDLGAAIADWEALLEMSSANAKIREMKAEAQKHIDTLATPTPSPTKGATPSKTPRPSRTPTPAN